MNAKRLGLLFLLLGTLIIVAALAPVLQHPPALPNTWILIAGVVVAIFGALMVPNSGADHAIDKIAVTVQNTNLPFVGGRANATATTTVTVETPPPPPAP